MGYGVIGSTTDSGSVSLGSSPCTPALIAPRLMCGARFGEMPPYGMVFSAAEEQLSDSGAARAPLCSGLARCPLKAVARVRIPSGLHLQTPRFPGGLVISQPTDIGMLSARTHNSASRGVETGESRCRPAGSVSHCVSDERYEAVITSTARRQLAEQLPEPVPSRPMTSSSARCSRARIASPTRCVHLWTTVTTPTVAPTAFLSRIDDARRLVIVVGDNPSHRRQLDPHPAATRDAAGSIWRPEPSAAWRSGHEE